MSNITIVDQPIEEKAPIEEPTPPDFEREGIFLNERVAELFNMGSDEARRDARKIETLIEYAKAAFLAGNCYTNNNGRHTARPYPH